MSQPPVPFLGLPRQHEAIKDELIAVFSRAVDHAAFIGGEAVAGFEREFAAFVGSAHCVGVGSGTDALHLALKAMGLGPGSLAVTVPNTFIATTEAVSLTGAAFAFVDVDPDTALMDPGALAAFLKSRAKDLDPRLPHAVIPVHLYGQCADMEAINALAGEYGFFVLEDAAQAHGAAQAGKRAGTLGRAAAFSFYPGKNLGACGEAGAVTTDDPELAQAVAMLRDHGQAKKYYHDLEGVNARLDAIQAGFLSVKLKLLDVWNARRRDIAARYDAAFAGHQRIRPVSVRPGNTPVYHLYVIHVPGRDALMEALKERGVQAGLHYPVPLHLQACYKRLGHAPGSFPVAEKLARELISLPLFPEMREDEIARVIDAVLSLA